MNLFFIFFLLIVSIACKNQNSQNNGKQLPKEIQIIENDSIALETLTRNMYQWVENNQRDFLPSETQNQNDFFTEIDASIHSENVHLLQKSGFFAQDFINLYNEIAENMNFILQNNIAKWEVGYLSPFSNGANEWCNCQDVPSDDFYQHIIIENIKIKGNSAEFIWRFNVKNHYWGDFSYAVKAKKENNIWKIASLQGFEELNNLVKKIISTKK